MLAAAVVAEPAAVPAAEGPADCGVTGATEVTGGVSGPGVGPPPPSFVPHECAENAISAAIPRMSTPAITWAVTS